VLAWAAQAVAPGARVTRAAGLREGGNPWLLRLERAGTRYRAVLKTGDPASARTGGSCAPRSRRWRWHTTAACPCPG
jgi:hypothetical protein